MAHFFPLLFLIKISSILIFACNATNLPKFSSILIFGDSLLDTGNNNFIFTLVQANHPPYGRSFPGAIPTGRFSDGKLISDLLADALGIKETVPPFLDPNLSDNEIRTGVCFASAGSGYDDLTTVTSNVIPVSKQYKKYFKDYVERLVGVVGQVEARNIINSSFVFATSGSNDMTLNFYAEAPWALQYTLDGYQNRLLQGVKDFIKALYNGGCRKMAIAGLPPLGCGFINFRNVSLPTACLDEQNSDSQVYNRKLITMLAELQATLPGSRLVYADLFTPLRDMALNPLKYGFLISAKGCCGIGFVEFGPTCNVLTPTCPNPSQFLFWDSVHPTEAAYRVLSQYYVDHLLPQFL